MSGSARRLALAKAMLAAGFNVGEYEGAALVWPHAEGKKPFGKRDILRTWAAALAAEKVKVAIAAGSSFGAVQDDDTEPKGGQGEDLVASYKANFPKFSDGSGVRIAFRRTLPSGAEVLEMVSPAAVKPFRPLDWLMVPDGKGGTSRRHVVNVYMAQETPILHGMRFMPELTQAECLDHVNVWAGWGVVPTETGSCELFKAHLRDRVCSGNTNAFHYLWRWMAHMFQLPRVKPGAAIVLQSTVKGSGKSVVGEVLGQLVGMAHWAMVKEREHILGRFNAHLADALLIQVEEAVWARDPKGEGVQKSVVTERHTLIERKGQDAIKGQSFARVLITSNEEFVVPATEGERRFLVLRMTNENIAGPVVQAMMAELRDGGYQRLMFELMHADIAGFDPVRPPVTDALLAQIAHNMGVVEEWWQKTQENDALAPLMPVEDDGEEAGQGVAAERCLSGATLRDAFDRWRSKRGAVSVSHGQWGEALRRLGFVKQKRRGVHMWRLPVAG